MELNQGYIETEVGVIPADWKAVFLGELGESLIGLTYKPTDVRSDGILVLRSSNVGDGILKFDDNVFVEKDIPERIMVRPGDILICVRNGSRNLIGKCAQIDERANGMTFGAFMAVFRSPLHDFVYQHLQSGSIRRQINEHLGATINQITNKSLNSFKIPLPPTATERNAIAGALSDVDALIDSQEQFIVKKRDVKQGVVQALLTGKRRLPGFTQEWERMRLGDLGIFRGGNGFPTRYQGQEEGDFPFFKVSDMNNEGNEIFMVNSNNWISASLHNQIGVTAFPRNSIVFAKIGAAIFLERKKILHQESCIDNNMMCFIPHNSVAQYRFMHYLFLSFPLGKFVSTTALPSLSGRELAELEFKIPRLKEQEAIASLLSDMDTEITTLEVRLKKTRDIKVGMMQELLTGKTRLI